MPTRTFLLKQLELNYGALFRNLEGITHEESLIVPEAGGNCLNWVVGHIVASRCRMMTQLGIPPVWKMDLAFHYSGREEANWSPDRAIDLKSIETDLARSQQELLNAIEALGERKLTTPDDNGRLLGDAVIFFNFHEAYHGGQVALLRRIIGKPGVIRPAPLRTTPDLIGS
ncbi:MAG TPA: DinB family protein [Gemmatimonadaceae bacterium]|nr:DinB family protein [Gemmatimonadaceae bacterium]